MFPRPKPARSLLLKGQSFMRHKIVVANAVHDWTSAHDEWIQKQELGYELSINSPVGCFILGMTN